MYLYTHSQHIIHTLFQHTSNFQNSQIILGGVDYLLSQNIPRVFSDKTISSNPVTATVFSLPNKNDPQSRRQLPRRLLSCQWFGVAKKNCLRGCLMAPVNLISNLAPIAGSRYIYINVYRHPYTYIYIHGMFPSGLPTFLVWKNPPLLKPHVGTGVKV